MLTNKYPSDFDYYDEGLGDVSTLGELLMLTLFLIQIYGEDAPLSLDAGYNNVQSYVLEPPMDIVTGEASYPAPR